MIRHCVWVKFKASTTAEEREAVYAGLRSLIGKIDGLERASFGPNVSPEGRDRGYTDGFTMDFRDAAARDVYLADPDHKVAGSRLVAALEGGRDGILIFDIEV
ncbi:MAG TPA: Dabb family protein [Devosiaceae bacterium]|jgi:hypothetical protein